MSWQNSFSQGPGEVCSVYTQCSPKPMIASPPGAELWGTVVFLLSRAKQELCAGPGLVLWSSPAPSEGLSPKAVCVLAAGAASPPLATLQCQLTAHGQSLQARSSFGLSLKWHLEAKKPSSLVPLPQRALLAGPRNVPPSDTSHHL